VLGLKRALENSFRQVDIQIEGCVALFAATERSI